jgi:hypothetical protein
LEELEEIDNDPEAAAEAAAEAAVEAAVEAIEEEVEGWRIYQSQLGRLPQSRSYESPYSTQEPPVSKPRYQATASQEVARAPRARAPRARASRAHAPPITRSPSAFRSPSASRSPPRAHSRSLSEDEDELIPPPPRLRFESEISDIKRRSSGTFITYNCNIVI